jgi:beta-galactosidase
LPAGLRVLVIGREALTAHARAPLFAGLDKRLAAGLRVLVFEQTEKSLTAVFGLRCFTPGIRRGRLRTGAHPALAGIRPEDLADWRGRTTLGPLDGPPESLTESQRSKRVWRCSQQGVVASTIAEKPHIAGFRPLVDAGFDLRYTALWEVPRGAGRMVFCQLDVTDRLGADPTADRLVRNLVSWLDAVPARPRRTARRVAAVATGPLRDLPLDSGSGPPTGTGRVLVLPRGCGDWLGRYGANLRTFLKNGGVILAAGLNKAEGEALARLSGTGFEVTENTLWLNPLKGPLPDAFTGVSPAGIHWRRKRTATTVSRVPAAGWRSATGVLARIPADRGEIVWIAALPGDFNPEQRPDLVFSRVNTERLYAIVLTNLGVSVGKNWAAALGPAAEPGAETALYTDKRRPHDDPYAYMRW